MAAVVGASIAIAMVLVIEGLPLGHLITRTSLVTPLQLLIFLPKMFGSNSKHKHNCTMTFTKLLISYRHKSRAYDFSSTASLKLIWLRRKLRTRIQFMARRLIPVYQATARCINTSNQLIETEPTLLTKLHCRRL